MYIDGRINIEEQHIPHDGELIDIKNLNDLDEEERAILIAAYKKYGQSMELYHFLLKEGYMYTGVMGGIGANSCPLIQQLLAETD